MPYTRASSKGADAAWLKERAPGLVALLVPFGEVTETNPDHTGAALAEIVKTLCYTLDNTTRENVTTALADLIFARTNSHDEAVSEFHDRRLVLPPVEECLVDAAVALLPPRRSKASEQDDLAAHIASVLNDERTPAGVYDALRNALNEMTSVDGINDTPEFIAATLAKYEREQAEGSE